MSLHPREMQRVTRETYAAHCILINLGFKSEEIFVATPHVLNAEPPGNYACVIVRREGKQFLLWTQRLKGADCDRFLDAWQRFAEQQPTMARGELERMVRMSRLWESKAALVQALVQKGFELKVMSN